MKHYSYPLLLGFALLCSFPAFTQIATLRTEINAIVQSKKADIGIAVIAFEDGDTLSVNGDKYYTIMSVVKFPQALYVMHLVDEGKLKLDQTVHFSKEEFARETHSPMRDDRKGQASDIPLSEVLSYAVGKSDNIACDKLFALSGGIEPTEAFLRKYIKDIAIGTTYADMMKNGIGKNKSTPKASAQLLKLFFEGKILSAKSRDFIWNIMATTTYAPDRLKGLLPKDAVVGHKTGTYFTDRLPYEAINDIGITVLPDGKHYAIAVYVNNSWEKPEAVYRTIAELNKAVWDYYTKKK
jgi:beta-lactamase class A